MAIEEITIATPPSRLFQGISTNYLDNMTYAEFLLGILKKMDEIITTLKLNKSNALKIGTYENIKYRNNEYFSWTNKPIKYEIDLKINKKGLIFEVS